MTKCNATACKENLDESMKRNLLIGTAVVGLLLFLSLRK